MKIGIIILATGQYDKFVEPLCTSIRQFFITNQEVVIFVLTDSNKKIKDVEQIRVKHDKWPYSTLLRYHKAFSVLNSLKHTDYLFQLDADMRIVSRVDESILSDLVATQHPGFVGKEPDKLPHETNILSKAFVPMKNRRMYYAGAFNGGKTEKFLEMAETISSNIDIDIKNNIMPIWHDESHLQAYLSKNSPTLELNPSYCYPESWNIPYQKIILALDKNHKKIRANKML